MNYLKKYYGAILLILILGINSYAQTVNIEQPYPKTSGYISFVHPIVAFDKNGSSFNFSDSYTIGFPTGLNILKSDRIGFSFEITPFIKVDNGTDRVSSIMFHPGVMFRRKHGFTINTRMAFESSGRYGATLVFSKVLFKAKNVNYFVATPVGLRMGNDTPSSLGVGLQLGVSF